MTTYTIRRTTTPPEFTGLWNGPVWRKAETAEIASFHPAGSDHRPGVSVRALYDDKALYVHFKVNDRYIRSRHTQPQDPVCQDSCVEFFFQPKPGAGYLNVEGNAGGTFLCYYIEDHRRTPTGFERYRPIELQWFSQIRAYHSLPSVVEPELTEPREWHLEYSLPTAMIEAHVGPLGPLSSQTWQGNFYKCGDETSHPHWGAWSPIGEELNFHRPEIFALLRFE